jgi:hypothetical protein
MNPLMKPATHKLTKLKLSELSFVTDPANVHCNVVLTKAALNPLLGLAVIPPDDTAQAAPPPSAPPRQHEAVASVTRTKQ